jgi:hypothetical protein
VNNNMGQLSGDELTELLETGGLKLADLVDQTIEVQGYRLDEGQFGAFARIDAVVEGQEVEITSGGAVVLPQLKRLAERDAFPATLRVVSFPGQYGKDGYKFATP